MRRPPQRRPALSAVEGEVVAVIQVHGNTLTSTDDVIRAAGIGIGDRISDKTLSDAEARLRAAIKPDSVDVLKRFASISDPTQVLILIQLDEGPVRVDVPDLPIPNMPGPPVPRTTVVRRSRFSLMWVPILGAEDGYGFTYGAQFAFVGRRATRRRVVVPASWGGDKAHRGGISAGISKAFRAAPEDRRVPSEAYDPFFDQHADRTRVWGRTEWPLLRNFRRAPKLRGSLPRWHGQKVDAKSIGADVVVDTRVDPLMPHNAIFVRSAVERLLLFVPRTTRSGRRSTPTATSGCTVEPYLALRAVREDFSRPAPAFYKSILGGSRNLRGFRAGRAVGDTLVAGSVELRIPTTSPLRIARFGYSVFMDAGTTYDKGQRFRDQKLERGVGAGIWMTAPLFRFSAAVARGIGSGMRAHIGAGLTF